MKKIIVFVCLFTSFYVVNSQTLKPKRIIYEDSLICWDIGQSKSILKHIVNSKYGDSLQVLNDSIINNLILVNDSLVVDKSKLEVKHELTLNKLETVKKNGKYGFLVSFLLGIVAFAIIK